MNRVKQIKSHLTMASSLAAAAAAATADTLPLDAFNAAPASELLPVLLRCCSSAAWAEMVSASRPYTSIETLIQQAEMHWFSLSPQAWADAIAGHGQLGKAVLEQKQAMQQADAAVLDSLAQANAVYTEKHGRKCIVFAAGKSAKQLNAIVNQRILNSYESELRQCAEQVSLITGLRLWKLLTGTDAMVEAAKTSHGARSAITSHILDTTIGRPAEGVEVRLEKLVRPDCFQPLATAITDADGRVGDLLPPYYTLVLQAGVYRIHFDVRTHFQRQSKSSFYPRVSIEFQIDAPSEHYHVPLLLNPYGYSTYRGS